MKSISQSLRLLLTVLASSSTSISAISFSMSSSSCDTLPYINNIRGECYGIDGCQVGSNVNITGTMASLETFDNSWVQTQQCMAGYCPSSLRHSAGHICDWVDWNATNGLREAGVISYDEWMELTQEAQRYHVDNWYTRYKAAMEAEEEAEEEDREFQCGDPGVYILQNMYKVQGDLPFGWTEYLFNTFGSVKITNLATSYCEDASSVGTSYSMAGLASLALIGAAAFTTKKRRQQRRSREQMDDSDDQSSNYLEMGSAAVV